LSSSFSSSDQATSAKVILSFVLSYLLAFDFPKLIALFAVHPILLMIINATNTNKTMSKSVGRNSAQNFSAVRSFTST
jgi:hypothetical protein